MLYLRKWANTNENHYTHRDHPYLQNLAAIRGAVNVLTGLVHAQCHAVEQDHHDADPLEPRNSMSGVKEQSRHTAGNIPARVLGGCVDKIKHNMDDLYINLWIIKALTIERF